MKGRPTDRSRVGRFHNVEEKGNWVKEKDRKPTLEIRRQRSVRSLSLSFFWYSLLTKRVVGRALLIKQTWLGSFRHTHSTLVVLIRAWRVTVQTDWVITLQVDKANLGYATSNRRGWCSTAASSSKLSSSSFSDDRLSLRCSAWRPTRIPPTRAAATAAKLPSTGTWSCRKLATQLALSSFLDVLSLLSLSIVVAQ